MAANPDSTVLDEIEALLRAPDGGAGAPTLARLEHTLTEGYARALVLEAERWRVERRLGEMGRTIADADAAAVADELASLGSRLSSAEGELRQLRTLLGTLRSRARVVRRS